MKLEFLPEARSEFVETVNYYEEKQLGLGKRFRAEIAEVCSTIGSAWAELSRSTDMRSRR